MQFNGETNSLDLISDIDFWTKDPDARYTIAQKTRNVNLNYDKVIMWIMQADGRWHFDDNNKTDLPIGTTNLVSTQRDYEIAADAFLNILKVLVKDRSGNWKIVLPITKDDPKAENLLKERTTGVPNYYIKLGNSIIFDREPDYAQTNGVKIWFQRDVTYFEVDDTTEVPGFARPFHRLLSLLAAYDWCASEGLNSRAAIIEKEILKMKADLMLFFAGRSGDAKTRMRLHQDDYGQNLLKRGGGYDKPAIDLE